MTNFAGMNFSDYLSLYWHSWVSEASLLLVFSIILFANWKRISRMAADIRRNFPDARIIFIRPTSESSIGERLEMSEMVGKGSMTRHMAITRSIDSIKDAVVMYSSDDMAACLHKRMVRRIIAYSSSLSFFFFGKDEKSNLTNASMVYDSDAFSRRDNLPVSIYTSNTLGGTSKVLEEHISKGRAAGKKIGWKFIDQSYLAVASVESARQKLTPLVKSWDDSDPQIRLMAYMLVDTGFAIALSA